jgi:hypothetical protein
MLGEVAEVIPQLPRGCANRSSCDHRPEETAAGLEHDRGESEAAGSFDRRRMIVAHLPHGSVFCQSTCEHLRVEICIDQGLLDNLRSQLLACFVNMVP